MSILPFLVNIAISHMVSNINNLEIMLRNINILNDKGNYLRMKYFIYIRDGKSNDRMIIKINKFIIIW